MGAYICDRLVTINRAKLPKRLLLGCSDWTMASRCRVVAAAVVEAIGTESSHEWRDYGATVARFAGPGGRGSCSRSR